MDLYSQIINAYPELKITKDFDAFRPGGQIQLCDDGDGIQYISKWEYSKPLPEGMKVGKN